MILVLSQQNPYTIVFDKNHEFNKNPQIYPTIHPLLCIFAPAWIDSIEGKNAISRGAGVSDLPTGTN